jgi:ankyrin repeat protein
VARLVREGAPVDAPDERGWTPLRYAALRGDQKMVSLLLQLGADPNASGQQGGGPLVDAAWAGSVPVLKALLDAGADLSRLGGPAVASALRKRHLETARWLLEHGVYGEWIDEDGQSLLDHAVAYEQGELLGPLLRAGANPNGASQSPPLAVAIRSGQEAWVDLLLEAGARVD